MKKIVPSAFEGTPWAAKKIKKRKDKLLIVNHILLDGTKARGKVKVPKQIERGNNT
ncbi:MAG: hypothetical protein HFG97_07345 [Dorea sp.]|nr:hypothetical protein [Dorea sp.]